MTKQIKPGYATISALYESGKKKEKEREGCPSNDGHPNGKTIVDRIVTWRCVRLL